MFYPSTPARLTSASLLFTLAAAVLALAVATPSAMAMGKKKMTTTVRIHAEANSMDGEKFSQPIAIPYPPNQVYIQKLPTISEFDIQAFKSYPRENGTFGAMLMLSDRGKHAIEAVSIQQPRTYMIIVVNGRFMDPVFIDKPVSDGRFYIKTGLSAADIKLFEENFKSLDGPMVEKKLSRKERKAKEKRENLTDPIGGMSMENAGSSQAPPAGE